MPVSRQYKALRKIVGFFGAVWGALGVVVGGASVGWAPRTLASFGITYAIAGGITGIVTALILARAESGKSVEDIPVWRVTLWGMLGGLAPAVLFGGLGLVFGAPSGAMAPLLSLGVVGGGLGGVITGSASALAKRGAISGGEQRTELPPSPE